MMGVLFICRQQSLLYHSGHPYFIIKAVLILCKSSVESLFCTAERTFRSVEHIFCSAEYIFHNVEQNYNKCSI